MNSKLILFVLFITITIIINNLKICYCEVNYLIREEEIFTEVEKYKAKRKEFMKDEESRRFGYSMKLNGWERGLNRILMNIKKDEFFKGFEFESEFIPTKNINNIKSNTKSSKIFEFLKTMPKGGSLNIHEYSLCDINFLISLTYKNNLWQNIDIEYDQPRFRFSIKEPPASDGNFFVKVSEIRKKNGAKAYDNLLRNFLNLNNDDPLKNTDIETVSKRLTGLLYLVEPLISFYPNFKDYFKRGLKKVHADGIQYIEFRGPLAEVYDLDGTIYTAVETVQMYKNMTDEFISQNPDFIGCKFIYAPMRNVETDFNLYNYIEKMEIIKRKFPDFVAGFNLVGEEDNGRPLTDFYQVLSDIPGVNLFLNAGETNWYGMPSDENLIDAILFNSTKRIGHGLAILKHPNVLKIIKEEQIAIEINPISNLVLKFVNDIRNHPAAVLIAGNYPMVISSDAPCFWDVSPLTHDFYQTFLGIASKSHDLKLIKQFVHNSINFSSMTNAEKKIAFQKLKITWDKWVDDTLAKNNYVFDWND